MSALLRVLIVDDESLARMRLAHLVNELSEPLVTVVGQCADALEALKWLDHHEVDCILLDIQMPGISGVDLASRLRRLPNSPAVVFVTAHPEHALTAFELEAVDYLTKPVRLERLQAALQRVAQRVKAKAVEQVPQEEEPVLIVSDRGRVIRVPFSEVLYLKAELKYVTLRTASHSYVLDDSLAELEQRLGDRVLRIHRNALVVRRAVASMERRLIVEDDGEVPKEGWAVLIGATQEWLAVSRRQVSAVREALAATV